MRSSKDRSAADNGLSSPTLTSLQSICSSVFFIRAQFIFKPSQWGAHARNAGGTPDGLKTSYALVGLGSLRGRKGEPYERRYTASGDDDLGGQGFTCAS